MCHISPIWISHHAFLNISLNLIRKILLYVHNIWRFMQHTKKKRRKTHKQNHIKTFATKCKTKDTHHQFKSFSLCWTWSFIILGMSLVLWTLQKSGTESLKKDSVKMNTLKTNNSISIRWLSKNYLNQFHISFIAFKIKSVAKLSTKFNDWNKKLSSFSKIFCNIMTPVTSMVLIYFVSFSFTCALLYLLLHVGIMLISFKIATGKSILGLYQSFKTFASFTENIFVWGHILR